MPSSMKKTSRKPSVLVSRQFTIPSALNGYPSDYEDDNDTSKAPTSAGSRGGGVAMKKNNRGKPSSSMSLTAEASSSQSKKIVWDGRDVTPISLHRQDDDRSHSGDISTCAHTHTKSNTNNADCETSLCLERVNTIFESLNFDDGGSGSDNLNDMNVSEYIGVPWIPTVMKELCHSFLDNSPAVSSIHTNDNNIESQLRTTSVTTPTTSINKNEPYEDLEKILTETETMELFSKPSSSIPITSKYYKEYKGKNERYEQACLYQRDDCPKNFHERAAQTFHFYQLHQSIQTEITSNDVGVGGDAFHDDIGNDMIGGGDCDPKDVLAKTIVEELTSAAIMTEGCLLDVSDGVRPGEKTFMGNLVSASASYLDIIAAKAKQKFYHSYMVLEKLSILERAIQQSIFSSQQIKYRGVNIVNNDKNHTTTVTNTNADTEISGKNSDNCDSRDQLELLLSLECDLTANMKVTCMSWNKSNRDLLAVGYGGKRNSVHKEGFVMLWSIRNPQYPEKVFKFTSSVTTVAFSLKNFEILAVGLHDGKVLLYDIAMQVSFSSPMLDSAFSPGRHMSAVSKLQWVVDTHQDASEQLVSVSVDGRILKWSSKKGLSVSPLITLKRTDAKINKGKLQNTALGLSMDFLRDGMSYLAGSDDGSLYHCSLSYHQHPLTTIKAHTGPITSIHVTPFLDDVFMTSSTDSSVKLYNIAQKLDSVVEVLTIHPINLIGSINDVSWSPKHSTLFVLVAQDNRMELWDVAISCFDPIITLSCQEGRLKEASDSKDRTVVEFSHCGDIIAVGDDQGCVEFHRIHISKRDKIEHLGEVVKRLSK